MATLGSLAVGSKLKLGEYGGDAIIWIVGDHDNATYGSGITSLVTRDILCKHAFDAKEPSNSISDRVSYGNNTWPYANLRTWLNSDAAAGSWYVAMHNVDQSPNSTSVVSETPYDTEAGFLNAWTADEKGILQDVTTTQENYSNTAVGAISGATSSSTQKIYLLSCTEVGLAGGQTCGTQWSLFTGNASRIANYDGSAWYWWLRDANSSDGLSVRGVNSGGTLNNYGAYDGNLGVRPACNLLSSILVSDTVDEDGCYTVAWASAFGVQVNAMVADDAPYLAQVTVTGGGLSADNTTVEVCNNGFDAAPTWEDCTDECFAGTAHQFANRTKTAASWGVAARATVAPNQPSAYIDGMSGAFA